MDWMKILTAVFLLAMIIIVWPKAKYMLKNSPMAESGDWLHAILILLAVLGFVFFLILLV